MNADSRPFTPSDLEGCLDVFDSNVPTWFSVGERDDFVAFLEELPGPYLVLEAGGEIVGCGGWALAEEGGAADLCWGMIRSDLHRKGLGEQLTRLRVEQALERPEVRYVKLNTSQHTVAFYERLGFVVESVETDGYAPGLDRCDMRRGRADRSSRVVGEDGP